MLAKGKFNRAKGRLRLRTNRHSFQTSYHKHKPRLQWPFLQVALYCSLPTVLTSKGRELKNKNQCTPTDALPLILKWTYNSKSMYNSTILCLRYIHYSWKTFLGQNLVRITWTKCLSPTNLCSDYTLGWIHCLYGVCLVIQCFPSHTFIFSSLCRLADSHVLCIHQPLSMLWCSPAIFGLAVLRALQTSWIQLCLNHKQAGNFKDHKFKIC